MQRTIRRLRKEVAILKAALADKASGDNTSSRTHQSATVLSDHSLSPMNYGRADRRASVVSQGNVANETWAGSQHSPRNDRNSNPSDLLQGPEEREVYRTMWEILTDDCNLSATAGTGDGLLNMGREAGFVGRGAGALHVWEKDAEGIDDVGDQTGQQQFR